jgi:aspartate/methionine/tyrosine aminotransferase
MEKLTTSEFRGLEATHNLSDAHVHLQPSGLQKRLIIDRLPQLFKQAMACSQTQVDALAARDFMMLSGQLSASSSEWFLPVYASSISIDIVADYLARSHLTVALVEPTFDNIPDLMKRHGVSLQSMRLVPTQTYGETVLQAARRNDIDVIFLVMPNNPTGDFIPEAAFREVAQHCAIHGKLIVLDTSFRLFESGAMFDQHAILGEAEVQYIVIEDTGKFWPSLDLKLSFIFASPTLRTGLTAIYQDLLLNVSPLISLLVSKYSNVSAIDDLRSVRTPIAINRRRLRKTLGFLMGSNCVAYPQSRVSVEFVRLPSPLRSSQLVRELELSGVAILPGTLFFWSNPELGESYIRIALSRPPKAFARAMENLSLLIDHSNNQLVPTLKVWADE